MCTVNFSAYHGVFHQMYNKIFSLKLGQSIIRKVTLKIF